MVVIHISTLEAELDFAGLLAKVRAGEELLIEDERGSIEVRLKAGPYPSPAEFLDQPLPTK